MSSSMTKPKRRVSPLVRERARERMLALTPEQRAERLAKMRAGRERARSPERLAEIEAKIDALGEEFKSLPRGHERRLQIMRELEPLGRVRHDLKWRGE